MSLQRMRMVMGLGFPNIQLEFIEWRDEVIALSTTFTQLRFRINNSVGTMFSVENAVGGLDPDLTPPIQWAGNVSRSGPDACSFRWVADLGPTPLTAEFNSDFNTWYPSGNNFTARLINGDVGTTKVNRSVFQFARTSDLGTIIGQATKELRLTRIP